MSCSHVLPDVLPRGEQVLASHHLHLEPLPRLVGEARRFVREHAPPLPPETADALLLLTSELVTNAVLHARSPIEVGIAVAETSVLITVHDEDLVRPEQLPYESREGGWGLGLVRSLATRSAMMQHPGNGKTAWFILPREGDLPASDGAARRAEQGEQAGRRR